MKVLYNYFGRKYICQNVICFITTKNYLSIQHKMVLVVRQDIRMGQGKLAAQCAHAAVQAFKKSSPTQRMMWELGGQQKVVVKCLNESELIDLQKKALSLNIDASLIKDAGRTQLQAGTSTVLGIGPGPVDKIDLVTGHLKLL